MSEQEAAAAAPPAAVETPQQVEQKPASSPAKEQPKEAAEKSQEQPPKDEKKPKEQAAKPDEAAPATPRKRRTPSPRGPKKPKDEADGEDTESEPEKQPKQKRAKTTKGAKRGPKPGRKKKVAVEPEEDEDEIQRQVKQKVAALSDDIKGRFGQIVWAKMGGYPYWPCIITDPRLLPRKLQDPAMKVLDTKYLVFFYVSNNFAPIMFKWIEHWDDSKFNYREGHPEKDSKAPKRRAKLMQAIELADKEMKLPIEERADGLLKPEEEGAEEPEAKTPPPVKRKPGRPPKNKNAPKKSQTARKALKTKDGEEETEEAAGASKEKQAAPTTTQEEEEEVAGPTLSKEEIKAKVASRKSPKKKGADDSASAAGASAKKATKPAAKHAKSNGSEIDSKRKKEIELVVPHKTVKSADIREMTEEAAKKKLSGPKSKVKKDKGDYKVGDLGQFASKMTRLHAKESTRNNDELVGMMQELFKETLMYRSDVERSGLAAVIAVLRKSLSPTVGQTASALRKHMIKILENDTDINVKTTHLGKKTHHDGAGHGTKKRKAENGSSVKTEEQQQKTPVEAPSPAAANGDVKENSVAKEKASSVPAKASPTKKSGDAPQKKAIVKDEQTPSKPEQDVTPKPAPSETVAVKADDSAAVKTETATDKQEKTDTAATDKPASPAKVAEKPADSAAKDEEDLFEVPEHMDKNRKIFVDMLSKILDHNGSTRVDLAKEIEAALFERFKESNEDYLTQARIIIFGLKENAPMRERLFSGALHCLEFAYADDAFFKTAE